MRPLSRSPKLNHFEFLQNVHFTAVESSTALTICALLVMLPIALLDPPLGSFVIKMSLPLLAVWILMRKTPDRFAPACLFPAIYLLWFWAGTTPLLIDDRLAALTTNANDRVWLYILVGIMAYLTGTLLVRDDVTDDCKLRGSLGFWQERQLFVLLGLLAAGILLSWASITASEGIPIFRGDVDTIRIQIPVKHRLAFQLMVGLSSVMMPLNFLYLWTSRPAKYRRSLYAFSIFIGFSLVSLGSRGLILPSALTIFALRHYLRKRWPVKYVLIAGFVILPLLSISGYYRSLQHFGPTYALDLLDMGLPIQLQPFTNIYLYIRAPVATFRNTLGVIPSIVPYQQGSLNFGFLLQVLPGHHPSSDYFFKNLLGHEFSGAGEPASLLGTFYADWGTLGIFGGMLMTGTLAKALYIRMFRGSLGWVLAYCFLWQKLIGGLYGTLFGYVDEIIVPVIWIVSVWFLTNGTEPMRARARVGG